MPLRVTRHGANVLYVTLVAVLLASGWAALAHDEVRVVDLFAANLTTEILSLLVTLALVHRYLARQERAMRLRGSMGGVRRAGRALHAMAEAWSDLVKGALVRAPEPRPSRLSELFAGDLTAALVYLDPDAPQVRTAAHALRSARETLRAVVTTYGASLDPFYLAAIDDLGDDAFLDLFASLDDPGGDAVPQHGLRAVRHARALHFDRLELAIDCHNRIAADAARLRDLRTAPRGDAYSAAIPPDVDLRVPVEFAPEWWSVAPRPGAIRTVRFRDAGIPQADETAPPPMRPVGVNAPSDNELPNDPDAVRPFPYSVPA